MALVEEIQRVKSKDSPARGTTYILLMDRAARRRMGLCTMAGAQAGRGLEPVRGPQQAVESLQGGVEGFEDVLKGSKTFRGMSGTSKRL